MAAIEQYRPVDVGRGQGFVEPRRSQYPDPTAKKQFLKNAIPKLGASEEWKGVRILGAGSRGTVGLWKYVGPPGVPVPQYVAVKTTNLTVDATNPGSIYFDNEGKWHWILEQAKSEHIVTLLREPVLVAGKDGNNVERLLTEYCPMGSLRTLIQMRIQTGKPFAETTMWLILNCFIDGLGVMAYGKELVYSAAQKRTKIDKADNWAEICHFDLHSDNIFMGEYNMSHPFTPVMKIADFGESDTFNLEHQQDEEYLDWKLWLGLPELTSKEDFEKWNRPGSTIKSNLWMTGITMALLATLTRGDVFFRKQEPWDPRLDLRVRQCMPRWRPKGLTQPCGDLPSTNYSSELKQTIYEMMYVDPDLRPDLQSLKTRVQEGWRVAVEVSPHSEPWEDFVHPDPMESEWDPDAWNPDDEIETPEPTPVQTPILTPISTPILTPLPTPVPASAPTSVPTSDHDLDEKGPAKGMVLRIQDVFAWIFSILKS